MFGSRSLRFMTLATLTAAAFLATDARADIAIDQEVGGYEITGTVKEPYQTCESPQPGDDSVIIPPGGSGTVCNPGTSNGILYITVGNEKKPIDGAPPVPPGKGATIHNTSDVTVTITIE